MNNKFCIYDHEQHKILQEIEQKDGSVLVEIETTTVFPRKYFVPKSDIQPYVESLNISLSRQDLYIIIRTLNNFADQQVMQKNVDLILEIRDKAEKKLNEQN